MTGRVLVTGGSGYIGSFVIRKLIAEGWTVNTTIRNLAREAEVRKTLAVDDSRLHVFAADLMHDAGWAEAVADCSHVAHVASPFPAGAVKDENDLIVPAREGALRMLRAAKAAGVRRVVLTSSMAAIAYGNPDPGRPYDERDWSNPDGPDLSAYVKSKTIAERAARDWVAAEGEGMEFCTINPSAVLGPVLSTDYSTSIQFVERLMDGSVPGCPRLGFGIVDVRDLADLHVLALTAPGMANERFVASGPFVLMREVAAILRERLGEQARKVPTRNIPDFAVRLLALFDASLRQVTGELGRTRAADASHALEKLGWQTRPVEESIIDTARSLIDLGVVKA